MARVTPEKLRRSFTTGMDPRTETAVARLFERQHGALRLDQLLEAGSSRSDLKRRVASGAWAEPHHQVVALAGHARTFEHRVSAALALGGPAAAASHRCAAHLLGLDGWGPRVIEISSPRRICLPGVRLHRTNEMTCDNVVERSGLRVTTAERTIIDLCAAVSPSRVEDALDSALNRRFVTPQSVWKRLNRLGGRGRSGTARLRLLLADRMGLERPAQSAAESAFGRIAARCGMTCKKQHRIYEGDELVSQCDFAIPELKLAIEIDSYRWHSSRKARVKDARKQNRLERLGWKVLRYFAEDVIHDEDYVAQDFMAMIRRLSSI